MARPRTEPEPEVEEAGEQEEEIVHTPAWHKAYDYALKKGNTEKTAALYADSWEHDFAE